MRAKFQTVPRQEIADLRILYLKALPYCQDAFLEVAVQASTLHQIEVGGSKAGYFAVSPAGLITEFFIVPELAHFAHPVYRKFVEQHCPAGALVKSYDYAALSCALDLNRSVQVRGMLCRQFVERDLPDLAHLSCPMRLARAEDLNRIINVRQDVFSDPSRLGHAIETGDLYLFESGADLVGFGLIRVIIAGFSDVEIGIAVDEPFRNKGYAAYMLLDLVLTAKRRGLNPVSGCSIDNEPSIRLGMRVGFRARHRLIEIRFS